MVKIPIDTRTSVNNNTIYLRSVLDDDAELDVPDGMAEGAVPPSHDLIGLMEQGAELVDVVCALLADPELDLVLEDVLELADEPEVDDEGGELLVDEYHAAVLAPPADLQAGVRPYARDAADVPPVLPPDGRVGACHDLRAQPVYLVLALRLQVLDHGLDLLDLRHDMGDALVHLQGPGLRVLPALGEVLPVDVVIPDHLEGLGVAVVPELVQLAGTPALREPLELGVDFRVVGLEDDLQALEEIIRLRWRLLRHRGWLLRGRLLRDRLLRDRLLDRRLFQMRLLGRGLLLGHGAGNEFAQI
eukprot:395202-Hanusia_phi.AAC.2